MMFDSARPISTDSAACVPWIENAVNNSAAKHRLLLWVDAVGGFFVCPGNEIRVGQAVPGSTVDLPLLADLSRHHATIRRDEEGYTIEPLRDVRLNRPTNRLDQLAQRRQPDRAGAGPATAVQPAASAECHGAAGLCQPPPHAALGRGGAADGRYLRHGAGGHNHVVCRHWPHDVVLYRQHGGLHCPQRDAVGSRRHALRAKQGPLTSAFARDRRGVFVQSGGNLIFVPRWRRVIILGGGKRTQPAAPGATASRSVRRAARETGDCRRWVYLPEKTCDGLGLCVPDVRAP